MPEVIPAFAGRIKMNEPAIPLNNTSKPYRAVLLIIAAFIAIATILNLQNNPRERIWQFNFAPESAPDVEAFISISAE